MKQQTGSIIMLVIAFMFVAVLAISHQALAFDPFKARTTICTPDTSSSSVCSQGPVAQNPIAGPGGILNKAVNVLSIVTGVAAVIMIIIGGFKYVLASGDPANIKSAKDTIIYALIGLAIAAIAQAIVVFILNKL